MAKIGKIQEVAIEELVPYERNAKLHPDEQVQKIAASIEEFGFLSPCLIDKEQNVIAGHGRILAAKQLGLAKVPCLYIEGLTAAQKRAYILADNKLTELGGWDSELVSEELKWLEDFGIDIELTGFDVEDEIIDNAPVEVPDIDDEINELFKKDVRCKNGDIWRLGSHRLMCGDSTVVSDVEKLMAGNFADLLITDPPYNVGIKNASGMSIKNDDMEDSAFRDFLVSAFLNAYIFMRSGAAFYIWHADSEGLNFRSAVKESGLKLKENIIWVKNSFTLGRQDYQWKHEPCLYGWKEGAGHYFQKARNISTIIESSPNIEEMSREQLLILLDEIIGDSTVWRENKPQSDDLHPTMKPLPLIERQIKNSSKAGERVLDLFGGSGTTLLACEKLKRTCFMMEYDPVYVDVIINRWEQLTGQKAELINADDSYRG